MARYRLNEADPSALAAFGEAWAGLGSSIGRQVAAVLRDPCTDTYEEQNPNALRLAQERLRGFNEEVDLALEEALAEFDREEEAS